MSDRKSLNAEQQRLEAQNQGREDWRHWGPYLAERAWGTVREDYSAGGSAWEYFDHDQARSRAYRWNEDGLGGICDEAQNLCFSLALWNGEDPILKERAFGLTGNQGNHGEDVKEYYFYKDATPSHSYMRYLYKYPQAAYPYQILVDVNKSRSRQDPPFNLLDTGIFKDSRYWDVEVSYAKTTPDEIHVQIIASNRGDETKTLHILPTLLFRNTWSWGDEQEKPKFTAAKAPKDAKWAVKAEHESLGEYHLYGRQKAQALYTENETNNEKLWGSASASPYVKDAFHRYLINAEKTAVNPEQSGTKFSAWHEVTAKGGQSKMIELVLTKESIAAPFEHSEAIFTAREKEADLFYEELLPKSDFQDANIMRQSMAGMIWGKQFFHFDVARWLDGDGHEPPDGHKFGRNRAWRHLKAAHVISMPDKWEYPWFAAWDLAFHCAALALVDVDFAKQQIELLLKENYLHPNGQIPAYEWAFGDVNPPVLAAAALKVFRAERVQRGKGDLNFLGRIVHKLLMNYTWWLNAKDRDGNNVFEGGFLGLDNISVYDRSQPLPDGFTLEQADATGWVAMFSLNMTVMALELTAENADYEDVAIQCYTQFLGVANAIAGHGSKNAHGGLSLWDANAGFFKDLVVKPDGTSQHIDVYSLVGLIPMFACEVIDKRLLNNAPRFAEILNKHAGGLFDGSTICACPATVNDRGEHLLSLIDHTMLSPILRRLLSEDEFLSDYGIRSVSKIHESHRDLGHIDGIGYALIEYVPGESNSGLFGGNSNWRGPIWMPINYTLIQAIEKFHRYLGDDFKLAVPCLDNKELTLIEISRFISNRIVSIFRRDQAGHLPALPVDSPFQHDPHWKDLLLFHEYFHGDTGLGLGAMHQTGWTGLVANLVKRKYHTGVPAFWLKNASVTAKANPSATKGLSSKMTAANGCSQANKCGQK